MPKKLTQEEAIEKALRTHGDKYDLSKMVYRGSKDLVTVGCKDHGYFEICFRDFTKASGARGCQECSMNVYIENRVEWNLIPEHEAIRRMTSVFGDKFDYSEMDYKSFSQKVKIKCPIHGYFWMRPDEHEKSLCGCTECGKEQSIKSRTHSKSKWVEVTVPMFEVVYDYSLVPDGINSKTKFNVICPKHGEFPKTWNELASGSGCPTCTLERRSEALSHDTDIFIKNAEAAKGKLYDYSIVEYVASDQKVNIICRTHGSFPQKPNKHLAGQGCPKCAKNGFRVTKPGHLYVLHDGYKVKVGITNRKVSLRRDEINYGGNKFEIIHTHYFECGQHCLDFETLLLQKLRSMYRQTVGNFDGVTESFDGADVVEMVIQMVGVCDEQ